MRWQPLSTYKADNSGHHPERYPGSLVETRNRIDFLTHESLVRFSSGPNLARMFERFSKNLTDRLANIDAVADWEEIPDFLGFIQTELGTTVLEAIAGP